jgi:hypothetical protein
MAKKEAEVLRKITVKSVMGKDFVYMKDTDLVKKKKADLMRVYGCVTTIKPGSSDYGPFVRFVGEFKAVNVITGEMFVSPAAILPRFLEEQVAGACSPENLPVTFGFDIGIKLAVDSKSGIDKYEFTASPVLIPKSSNAMIALEETMAQKALPAPIKKAA